MEHSVLSLSTLGALYSAFWVYSKHSNMQVEHTGSTLPSCLNTLGALYQAVWTRWEHSTKLFEHAGSTLPSCLNTMGALYQAVWTRWEHSSAFTLTESTTVYPAFYARRVAHTRILSTPGALSCARHSPKEPYRALSLKHAQLKPGNDGVLVEHGAHFPVHVERVAAEIAL